MTSLTSTEAIAEPASVMMRALSPVSRPELSRIAG